jgi:MoxR-like ATPase
MERTDEKKRARRGRPVPKSDRELREEVGKSSSATTRSSTACSRACSPAGHALLEGVPGLGKTMLVRTLAEALTSQFSRIQFTPDMMPADIIGTTVIDETQGGGKSFSFRKGPDLREHRPRRRDQPRHAEDAERAARGDAGASRHGGQATYTLEEPFFVLATQNPLESEGTYPLPEAQLDRFFFKLHVPSPKPRRAPRHPRAHHGYRQREGEAGHRRPSRSSRCRSSCARCPVARHVQDYAVRLLQATHPTAPTCLDSVKRFVKFGASPRGAQALLLAAKIRALFEGRFAASLDDVRAVALPALRHRVLLNFEGEAEGIKTDEVLAGDPEAPPRDVK